MTNLVQDTKIEIDEIELYISALEDSTFVSVTAPSYDGPNGPDLKEFDASLYTVLQVRLNPIMRITTGEKGIGISKRTNKVIRVTSNKAIVCYGINKKQYSTDGFLALPVAALGKNWLLLLQDNWQTIQKISIMKLGTPYLLFNHLFNILIFSGRTYFAFCNFPINVGDDRCQFAAAAIEDGTIVRIDLLPGVTIDNYQGSSFTGPVSSLLVWEWEWCSG